MSNNLPIAFLFKNNDSISVAIFKNNKNLKYSVESIFQKNSIIISEYVTIDKISAKDDLYGFLTIDSNTNPLSKIIDKSYFINKKEKTDQDLSNLQYHLNKMVIDNNIGIEYFGISEFVSHYAIYNNTDFDTFMKLNINVDPQEETLEFKLSFSHPDSSEADFGYLEDKLAEDFLKE